MKSEKIELINKKEVLELIKDFSEKETGAFTKGYNKAVRDIYNTIKSGQTVKSVEMGVGNLILKNNDGWISVNPDEEDSFPKADNYILLSFSNFSIPLIGRYEEDEEGGAFYIGDDDETCVSQDLFVNAWMSLPESYKEEE